MAYWTLDEEVESVGSGISLMVTLCIEKCIEKLQITKYLNFRIRLVNSVAEDQLSPNEPLGYPYGWTRLPLSKRNCVNCVKAGSIMGSIMFHHV